jgi:hypothetical protein
MVDLSMSHSTYRPDQPVPPPKKQTRSTCWCPSSPALTNHHRLLYLMCILPQQRHLRATATGSVSPPRLIPCPPNDDDLLITFHAFLLARHPCHNDSESSQREAIRATNIIGKVSDPTEMPIRPTKNQASISICDIRNRLPWNPIRDNQGAHILHQKGGFQEEDLGGKLVYK